MTVKELGNEAQPVRADNRLGLNYLTEAERFKKFSHPLIDVHSHIHGGHAAQVYERVARLYGVGLTYSMTHLEELLPVQEVLKGTLRLIAMPKFASKEPLVEHGVGYLRRVEAAYRLGARIVKFWNAPRLYDFAPNYPFADHPLRLTSPGKLEVMEGAARLGMYFMVHIADPDTWFHTKYRDSVRYGTKRQNHLMLEEMLTRFVVPTIGAHMAGSAEDLEYLSSLLERFPHLYLDVSATKWIVREISKHPIEEARSFFIRWQERILFGSDIVTQDAHLVASEGKTGKETQASSAEEAFELYASRYWALRTLFETNYVGESPIADGDLHMVAPDRFSPLDAPALRGLNLPDEVLERLYFRNAERLLGSFCQV